MIGRTLAQYEIIEKLGQGGMGEVFRARDSKLGRDVAIKILPADMAHDEGRLKRFQREAQTVAGLDHPNIVTVYDIDTVDGMTFMAMQLVEGQTLTERLQQGALALDEILRIAAPIADALGAAHEAGVTHRDMKPGNVVVGDADRVHVLDFGLAKLDGEATDDSGQTQTMVEHLTGEGQIVGTVAYMSPEQAQGKPVDGRSDIFSFGIVLHQMATGELPFQGENQISVITAILRDQPELVTTINSNLPRHLARIVRRCLQKDPNKRYQSARDLRLDVETLQVEVESGEWSSPEIPMPSIPTPSRGGLAWQFGIALLLLGLVGGWLLGRRGGTATKTEADSPASRPAKLTALVLDAGRQSWPSMTPDGEWFVYEDDDGEDIDILLRSIDGLNSINLTATSADDDTRPVFSPDGKTILFNSRRQGGGLFTMGRTGESVRKIAEELYDGAWSPDGTQIVAATQSVEVPYGRSAFSDLRILDLASGEIRDLLTVQDAVEPSWSPDGSRIAFWGLREGSGQRDLWTVSVADGSIREVTNDAATDWNPNWSPDGAYLYFSSDRGGVMNLWRLAIDQASGKLLGEAEPITLNGSSWGAHPSFGASGDQLIYTEWRGALNIHRIPFDPVALDVTGPNEAVTTGAGSKTHPSLAPDGERIAFITSAPEDENIFVMRTDGSEMTQLTNDSSKARRPIWSPDGQHIVFYSDRSGDYGTWVMQPDGRGLREVYSREGNWITYASWHPSGESLLTDILSITSKTFDGALVIPFTDPVDESQVRQVWKNADLDGRLSPSDWHLDERRIAGTMQSGTDYAHPAVYDIQTERIRVFGGFESTISPQWIPGTDYLLVEGDTELILLDTVSGEHRSLFSVAPNSVHDFFSVSRDGRWIYFTVKTDERDIWLLESES